VSKTLKTSSEMRRVLFVKGLRHSLFTRDVSIRSLGLVSVDPIVRKTRNEHFFYLSQPVLVVLREVSAYATEVVKQ
jgi:hypothetical protein